ncbi:hypothetical protein SO802_015049 [Lithocarpus litseifolius]|uniref:Uncharacterized protein n=1 Tax=Lithocarpus litseifolius TaxID=425828 RepID=A0AAW2CV13_9ROSI
MSPSKKTTPKKPRREVDFESLEGTFIPDVFRYRTWAPLFMSLVDVHHILIQEFFLNAIVEGDHLNCWVRGKEFTVSAMSIQNFLQIIQVILESSLSYEKRTTSVSVIALDLGGEQKKQSLLTTSFSLAMRTLAYIMLFNLFPQEEVSDDSAFHEIDHVMRHERVRIPFDLPVMKREDQISAQTMTRSKARLHGLEEGEKRVKGEDTAHEGGNTDEDIDNFTLGPEDMEASPSQP